MVKQKLEAKSSVKTYQQGIDIEKQKMGAYTKKMGSSVKSLQGGVKSLQGEFKKHGKEMREAGRAMIAEGNRNMAAKVGKFSGEIKNQIKENKEAIANMGNGVQFFLGEINKKKKDFRAYARGPFNGYIKLFGDKLELVRN